MKDVLITIRCGGRFDTYKRAEKHIFPGGEDVIKKICYTLLTVSLLTTIAVADEKSDAVATLKIAVNDVMSTLSNDELALGQKKIDVVETVEKIFDFPLMAKLSLGKKYWKQCNEAQRTEFTNLFVGLIQDLYTSKLEFFSDERVVFESPVMRGRKMHIPTILFSKGKEFAVLYKMYQSGVNWMVYDVSIEGVSLIQTYRSQYQHIMKEGEIDDLLAKMRDKMSDKG